MTPGVPATGDVVVDVMVRQLVAEVLGRQSIATHVSSLIQSSWHASRSVTLWSTVFDPRTSGVRIQQPTSNANEQGAVISGLEKLLFRKTFLRHGNGNFPLIGNNTGQFTFQTHKVGTTIHVRASTKLNGLSIGAMNFDPRLPWTKTFPSCPLSHLVSHLVRLHHCWRSAMSHSPKLDVPVQQPMDLAD